MNSKYDLISLCLCIGVFFRQVSDLTKSPILNKENIPNSFRKEWASDHTDCLKRRPVYPLFLCSTVSTPLPYLYSKHFPVWLSCFPTLEHKLFQDRDFVYPQLPGSYLLEGALNVCLAPCPRETNSDLRGTDFIRRVLVILTLVLLECPSNVRGERSLGLHLVGSLSVSSDHLFEGKSRSNYFPWQLGRRVICNLYFQAYWLFCVSHVP